VRSASASRYARRVERVDELHISKRVVGMDTFGLTAGGD
jgi:hypothetical protein